MASCSAPKARPFGTWKCRKDGCKELQKDPEYESSPMRCTVLNTIPGNCHCCVKELDAEAFIRVARGMIYQGLPNYNGPSPGIKNCPGTCPYKLVWQEPDNKGKMVKLAKCAFTGDGIKAWPLCPCNVLGNDNQQHQLSIIRVAIERRRKYPPSAKSCGGNSCPDGVIRCGIGDTDCPVIRIPFADLPECPFWRIPAKTLPAPDPEVEKIGPISTRDKPKSDTKGEPVSRKPAPKEKKTPEYRQSILEEFETGE